MQSSIVGLSILWGLASFGVQGISSRARTVVPHPGKPVQSGDGRIFDRVVGRDRLGVRQRQRAWKSLPKAGVSTGERPGLAANPLQEQSGWLLQVQDVSQVEA